MNGQRFVNMMLACNLPRKENLTGPALRVIATAAARGHMKKQEYDNGHTATRIYKSQLSAEKMGKVTTHGRKLSYEDFLNALMRVSFSLINKVFFLIFFSKQNLLSFVRDCYHGSVFLPLLFLRLVNVCTHEYVIHLNHLKNY
jgi:hypothetical protein